MKMNFAPLPMFVSASQLIPDKNNETRLKQIFSNPFFRLFIYLIVVVLVLLGSNTLISFVLSFSPIAENSAIKYGIEVFNLFLLFFAYKYLILIFEKREVHELSTNMAFTEIVAGIFIGLAFIFLVVMILTVPGYFAIEKFNPISSLLKGFFRFSFGAFFEELLFRLIIFKLLEEYFGSWISLTFGAILFGAAHLLNQNATVWSSFAIALEAGILITLTFMLTRRIWLAFGLHFGWNFAQASILGLPASGIQFPGLISPEVSGPEWFTGGAFGIEASPVTVVLGLLLSLILLRKVLHDDQVILPGWHHKRKTEIKY